MVVDTVHTEARKMNLGTIQFEKTGQAPSPSKDFHQLLVTDSQVILRTWRISVRKDQRYIPPSQRKVPLEEFDEDTMFQTEISRIFGSETLRLVHGIVCKDWLARLPQNILIRIAGFLDLVDISRLGSVCRSLRKVCASDELWERIFISHCDTVTQETRELAQELGWKKVFYTNKLQLQVQMRRRKGKNSAELKKKAAPMEQKIPQTFVTQTNGHAF
ncbi:F-box only protein 36-like [Montipora foliosa]|uniref:F-box only protein 36-like n=1 Tax=Montipora foliosa TaxID=591990 RepID=UPI0035F1F8DA